MPADRDQAVQVAPSLPFMSNQKSLLQLLGRRLITLKPKSFI